MKFKNIRKYEFNNNIITVRFDNNIFYFDIDEIKNICSDIIYSSGIILETLDNELIADYELDEVLNISEELMTFINNIIIPDCESIVDMERIEYEKLIVTKMEVLNTKVLRLLKYCKEIDALRDVFHNLYDDCDGSGYSGLVEVNDVGKLDDLVDMILEGWGD